MSIGNVKTWVLISVVWALSAAPGFSQGIEVSGENTVKMTVSSSTSQQLSEFIKALKANDALANIQSEKEWRNVAVQFDIKKGQKVDLIEIEETAKAKGLTVVVEAQVIHMMSPGQPCTGMGMGH